MIGRNAVFPNPAEKNVTITTLEDGKKNIRITSAEGKIMFKAPMQKQNMVINVAQWPAGIHIVEIFKTDNVIFAYKLIVKK